MAPADHLVGTILETFETDGKIKRGDEVVLMVNGLGSTPPLELAVLARAALRQLKDKGIEVVRAWAGTFLSALDMPGFSLSIMPITAQELERFDAPVATVAWPGAGRVNNNPVVAAAEPARHRARSHPRCRRGQGW